MLVATAESCALFFHLLGAFLLVAGLAVAGVAFEAVEILHVAGAGAVSALFVALVATVGLPHRPKLASERLVPARV